MTRRSFAQMFGIGASVVPLIGGIPEVAAEAKLIAVPQVEPVSLHTSSDMHAMANEVLGGANASITVDIRTKKGERFRFTADSFDIDCLEHQQVPAWEHPYYPTGPMFNHTRTVKWSLHGHASMPTSKTFLEFDSVAG